jgi:hypothetical protein
MVLWPKREKAQDRRSLDCRANYVMFAALNCVPVCRCTPYYGVKSHIHTKEVIGCRSSAHVGLRLPKIQTLRPRIHNDDGTVSRGGTFLSQDRLGTYPDLTWSIYHLRQLTMDMNDQDGLLQPQLTFTYLSLFRD